MSALGCWLLAVGSWVWGLGSWVLALGSKLSGAPRAETRARTHPGEREDGASMGKGGVAGAPKSQQPRPKSQDPRAKRLLQTLMQSRQRVESVERRHRLDLQRAHGVEHVLLAR